MCLCAYSEGGEEERCQPVCRGQGAFCPSLPTAEGVKACAWVLLGRMHRGLRADSLGWGRCLYALLSDALPAWMLPLALAWEFVFLSRSTECFNSHFSLSASSQGRLQLTDPATCPPPVLWDTTMQWGTSTKGLGEVMKSSTL